jgi:hypothetical protein
MTRRTGSGASINPDHIAVHWAAIVLLAASLVAAGVASIDGLLHAALWMVPPALAWTLPVAVDVFLVATAIATLALRKRGARWAAWMTAGMTVVLVLFSAATNWLYVASTAQPGPAAWYGPWIKAAMPVLLLAATEIVAALTTTKNAPRPTRRRKPRRKP